MRFNYSLSHVPGKDLTTADTLSHLPVLKSDSRAGEFQKEVDAFVNLVVNNLPATVMKLKEIENTQNQDAAKQSVWWPNIHQHTEEKVSKCPVCCKYRTQLAEPLIPSQLPDGKKLVQTSLSGKSFGSQLFLPVYQGF